MTQRFINRAAAGRLLAEKLAPLAGRPGLLVLALPRGGVPVAAEVAHRLGVPLDVLEVRALEAPSRSVPPPAARLGSEVNAVAGTIGPGLAWRRRMLQPGPRVHRIWKTPAAAAGQELFFSSGYSLGAVASGDYRVFNRKVRDTSGVKQEVIEALTARELQKLHRHEQAYRHGRPALVLRGRPVILTDDAIVTASTLRVAVAAVREARAGPIIVAAPVAARESYLELRSNVQGFVTLCLPREFGAVGQYYADYDPVADTLVRELLDRAWQENAAVAPVSV